ncbi:zinc finger BED domain-containing protein RICESLEEPER 2-like [Arachis stenosperma]|uniref:zinc finger BED domain-containing protein RICESLEEPER 2-like n=1 Tax=Arachis stenosperma TaxID=217475 RepID=UPI0025ABFF40|nr:zinc finger BED domain-containing protein RICESLEEPER 2-like [Arachis stenosperma]
MQPTSNEVPNEWTPEVGGENVESVVRSSMDSGVLTKPPPHPRSKKKKVIQLMWVQLWEQLLQIQLQALWKLVKRMVRMIPMKVTENHLDLDLGLGEHFTKDPKSKPSHPRAKCNSCGASYACDSHRNGRITIAKDCWNLYISEKNRLKTVFKQPNQSVCLTTDCWTSVQNLNYMCLTAHYIDHDWKLQKRVINFCLVKNHKGETIGRKIEICLLGWGISRVFTITVDNASSNDTAISYLRTRMEDWNLHPLKREHLHVRCCAHILNLVVNDGLKEMHESISKIRNAIRYVRASPSHMNRFKIFIKEARIQDKCTVQLDVPTRWNSTYTMVESGLKFQKAFKRLGERDIEYALMQGGILRNSVSGSLLVTSSQYFHEFCKILRVFKASCGSRDPLLGSIAERMKLKYDKYWGNIKNINMMIFVAMVLDPRYKLKFVNFSFEKLYDDKDDADFLDTKVKETFSKMFECYVNANNGGRSSTSITMDGASDVGVPDGDMAGDFFKEVHFHEIINKNEVDLYLMDGLEKPRD